MSKKKKVEEVKEPEVVEEVVDEKVKEEVKEEGPMMYEGYDIKWLRKEPSHPDYHLVAEYDEKYGK